MAKLSPRACVLVCLAIAGISLIATSAATPQAKSRKAEPVKPNPTHKVVDFSRDVRPILSEHCYVCHGPDAEVVKGNLRLDLEKDAKRPRKNGPAIVAGKPEKSRLWLRVIEFDSDLRMPPPEGKPLSEAQKSTLKRWIAQGGEYKKHWSFIPPKMPAIPAIKNPKWARNAIDNFIGAELDAKKLKPEAEARKEILLRRASLTLTGLPPTPEETQDFLADKSPGAYEKQVDRLLASPRYGEHQARYWLDAVRYGDTHGLHLDNERAIYPYRDWVVRQFNNDLPFDKFSIWQIGGDLLPDPTSEQLIATGYVRMNPTTNEGGAIEEEFLAKNTFDRVDTLGTVFLGLTITCARCHDHKYDPISARDYYGLYAIFNSTTDKPLDGNDLVPAPVIRAVTPEMDAHIRKMKGDMDKIAAQTNLTEAKSWLKTANVEPLAWSSAEISAVYSSLGFDAVFAQEFGPEPGGIADPGDWKPIKIEPGKAIEGIIGKDSSAVYVRLRFVVKRAVSTTLGFGSDDGIRAWLNGTLIHDNKAVRGVNQATDNVTAGFVAGENELIVKIVNNAGQDGFRLAIGNETDALISKVAEDLAKNDPTADRRLRELYLEFGSDGPEGDLYRKTKVAMLRIAATAPFTLIAQELEKPRPAHILRRGEYNLKGAEVPRAVPAALGKWPAALPKNRLGFSKWLVSPDNPLTVRVFVNRIWQQHFGTGIVRTAEDFGAQGEFPSHPELLDYLSVRFAKEGMSLKKLHRLILTSATFRQGATLTPAKRTADPENRLLSRGPRFRLDAEVIRDQALFVSGLLKEDLGGKGMKPYQPSGLWEAIGFLDSNTSKYAQDKGDSIYRRSLYMFWKRTSPPPAMMTFDAPMRESCTVRRSRTNTPMQALVTMNDPTYLEASRVFSENLLSSATDVSSRLKLACRKAWGRAPTARELSVLTSAVRRYRSRFAASPDSAKELVRIGDSMPKSGLDPIDVGTWMMVATTLFNTDEFLTQH